MQAITRRRIDQPALTITVHHKGCRTLTVSIRGSTVGVLLALAIMAGIAWIALR